MTQLGEWLGMPDSAHSMVILLISLFVYAFAYHALDASLPFISDEINKSSSSSDAEFYGQLKSVFGGVQFIGTILVGRAGDILGGKICLFAAQLASAANYGLVASAHSQLALFVAMLPTLLQQAYQASMMVVANSTDEDCRTKAFGRLTLGYGCGAILGPVVAGFVAATFGERGSVWLSCGLSLAVSLVIWITLPSHQTKSSVYPEGRRENICAIMSCSELARLCSYSHLRKILLASFVFNFGRGILMNLLPELAKSDFQMSPDQVGELLSYNELVSFFANGFLLGFLVEKSSDGDARVSERSLMIVAMAGGGAGLAGLCASGSVPALFVAMIPVVGSNVVNTIIASLLTKLVPQSDSGAVIGLSMAAMTLSNIGTPLLGAHLYVQGGLPAVCLVASLCMFVSAAFSRHFISDDYTRLSPETNTGGRRTNLYQQIGEV